VLLLENAHSGQANTIRAEVDALTKLSRHDVRRYDPVGLKDSAVLDLDEFDAVVIHYTVVPLLDYFLAPPFREQLKRFDGLKVQMVQDDYRWVDQITDRIIELGVSVLFTLVPEREIDNVWKPERFSGIERINYLAGYVPLGAENAPRPPLAQRPLDIVYRGRVVPFWLGRMAQEKAWIAQGVMERARAHALTIDVDWREGARIYGSSWDEFLRSGRATLGSESGSTITDFDGSLHQRVDDYLLEHPEADFEEVNREILEPYEGNVMMNIISPRVFEAMAAGTALVLFPGEYSGIIESDRHYIPLQKDFSNFDEVVERLRDLDGLEELTDRAHEEIVASGRYSIASLVKRLDRALDEHARPRPSARGRLKPRHAASRLETRLAPVRERLLKSQSPEEEEFPTPSLIRRKLGGAAMFTMAMRITRDWPEARAFLRSYARGSFQTCQRLAPPALVFSEIAKLGLMRTIAAQGASGNGRVPAPAVQVRTEGDTVTFTTLPEALGAHPAKVAGAESGAGLDLAELEAMPNGVPELVHWDHSAVSRAIKWKLPGDRGLLVVIGQNGDGRQDFTAISALGPLMPVAVRDLLCSSIPG
jgi:hypothetical protein